MTEVMQSIPARLKNVAVGGHVAGADQIIDDEQNKTQETINSEVNTALGNKANKSEMSVTPGTGANVDKTTIQLKSGTSATVLTQHQDISGKQDTINDLATIRSGAAAGATAQQPATTLSGYGITDAYTKSETYTKTEVNGLVDTTHQEYVTVNAYSALPATGSKDTIYRVSNYNGSTSQVDASVYSEYAWNGSQYIFLCVKSQIGEVFDISVYNNNAKYTDLAAALNGGANIPQSLRKGGMSVKFVQSSDNKYVQYRLMSDEWSTNTDDWAIADEGIYVDNPEFVYVKTDAEGKILWAIKADGTIYWGAGVPQQVIDYVQEKLEELSFDEYEDIVSFLGDLISGNETLQDLLDKKVDEEYIENPEFVGVWTDNDGRILFGLKTDGDVLFGYGIPSQIVDYVNSQKAEIMASLAAKVDKVVGKELIQTEVAESLSAIEDPERRSEITTDSEGKIISYRDADGVKHENVGVESNSVTTNYLNLSNDGLTDLERALKEHGFTGGQGDWSDNTELHIAEPRCAMVNFTGIDDIPQEKFLDVHGIMQFWDMNGNYFKKEVIMNAQGSSSMSQPKKNIAIDICNNNGWDDDDTFKLRIGNWVPQDSFHLKAYNTDFFKGVGVIGYKVADLVAMTYDEQINRTWKQALLPDYTFGDSTVNGEQINDKSVQAYNDARCMPDGFPCIVYLNGEFYGIYSWQIKKHRDNYHMSKSDAKNIHLDGIIDPATIFNGNIQWNQFEIRNPKNLCYSNLHYDRGGKVTFKYDADIPNGEDEIAGTDKNYEGDWVAGTYAIGKVVKKGKDYFISQIDNNDKEPITQDASGNKNTAKDPDFKNKTKCGWINCTTSVKVKQYIIDLSNIKSLIDAEATNEGKKAVFETYFDVNNFVDYLLVQMILGDPDGFRKNWQWTTWDGVKWYLNNYDKDFSFGANASGKYTMPAFMTFITGDITIGESRIFPMSCIRDYYRNELNTRYLNLRSNNVVSPNIIINLVKDWMDRIGEDNYKKESTKWNPPCDKDMILGNGWKLYAYTSYSDFYSVPVYQEGATYNIGDRCRVSSTEGLVVEATEETSSLPIVEYGHRDNFYRISNWIKNRFMYLDEYFNYIDNN